MVGWCSLLQIKTCGVISIARGQIRVKSAQCVLPCEWVSLFRDTAQDDLRVAPKIQSNSVQACVLEFSHAEVFGLASTASSAAPGGGGSQAPPVNVEAITIQEEVTTFHDERPPVEMEVKSFEMIDTRLLSPVESGMSKDIKKFLSRPVIVSETTVSTTLPALSQIYGETVPQNWLYSATGTNLVTMWQRKIEGFSVVRGTIVFRVQINPQRFQQGRFILAFFPQNEYAQGRCNLALTQSLTLVTQLPHVEVDCAANSSAILRVPYVSPTLGYNYVTGANNHGYVSFLVYSPLVDPSGSGDMGVTIWAHWEDIELMFPCQPQAGGRSRGTQQEQEEGGFTQLFKSVSKTAAIANEIPVLSSIAKPVGWAANLASKVTSAFGWSNPRDMQRATTIVQRTAPYMQNVDAIDESQNVGFSSGNNVQVLPGAFGSDIDEMSIKHLVSKPSWIDTFTITTSDTAGSTITNYFVAPNHCRSTQTQTTTNTAIYYPTPLFYIANAFCYWRGSITYTFKFVKTEFHSTRIMIAFLPPQSITFAYSQNEYLFREIYDLRETNEITVTVPYVRSYEYADISLMETSLTSAYGIGNLVVTLVNELKCPPTVSQSISVLVEVAGGPDTEFAVPRENIRYIPGVHWKDTVPTMAVQKAPGYRSRDQANQVFVLQALGTDSVQQGQATSDEVRSPDAIGQSDLDSGGLAASAFCIGEKIVSLRQVLKRASIFCVTSVAGTLFNVFPTILNNISTSSTSTFPVSQRTMDYWNYYAPLFMYRRGGSRIKLVDVASESSLINPLYTVTYNNNRYSTGTLGAPFNTTAVQRNGCCASTLAYTVTQGALEVEMPFYSLTPIQVINDVAFSTDGTIGFMTLEVSDFSWISLRTTKPAINNIQLWRQAADDTEFGYFIGCYPMIGSSDATFTQPFV